MLSQNRSWEIMTSAMRCSMLSSAICFAASKAMRAVLRASSESCRTSHWKTRQSRKRRCLGEWGEAQIFLGNFRPFGLRHLGVLGGLALGIACGKKVLHLEAKHPFFTTRALSKECAEREV